MGDLVRLHLERTLPELEHLIKQRIFIGTMCGPVTGMICYVSALSDASKFPLA